MEIKIVMHSELDHELKPDVELIKQGLRKTFLKDGVDGVLHGEVAVLCARATQYIQKEYGLTTKIAKATGEERSKLVAEKKVLSNQIDEILDQAKKKLHDACGVDFKYDFDLYFNRLVAGLMGSTCYMKDDFKKLNEKPVRNIMSIASKVENNGHHSTFGHSHITLEISGISKALAMVLNNEHEYTTSEKSARYTIMKDIEPTQNDLYNKWKEIFIKEIDKKYGDCQPFFDKKGARAEKLAQENARYMISLYTPTNMVYTTSFRQLNYLTHWFEEVIADQNANEFYTRLKPQMQEFVDFVRNNKLYSEAINDGKNKRLSLFGRGLTTSVITSENYALEYLASGAYLAQAHRHRTINYRINQFKFYNDAVFYYTPPILKNNQKLANEWEEDIKKVGAKDLVQGRLLPIIETGTTDMLLLKAKERVCALAQKEIRDITQQECRLVYPTLYRESVKAAQILGDEETSQELYNMAKQFETLSEKARCAAGYHCQEPCGFKDGINLDSLI